MTTSKIFWLGFGTLVSLLGLGGVTLLLCWPSVESLNANQAATLGSIRSGIGICLVLLVAASAILVVTGVVIRRHLVTASGLLPENDEPLWRSAEAAGFGAYCYDLEGHTSVWSSMLKTIHGLPVDAVLSRTQILELIHPHDRERFQQRLTKQFTPLDGEHYEFEYRIVRLDGEERWLRDRGKFTFAGSGRTRHPVQALGMISDITERKRGEEQEYDSEARYRAAFEDVSVGMYQADSQTRQLLRVNHRLCQMTGYGRAELVNRPCQDLLHPEDRDSLLEGLAQIGRGEIAEYRAEKRFVRKQGDTIWVDVTVNLLPNKSGQTWRTLAVIKDITERRQAEQKVREVEQRLRAFLDNSAVSGWMKDEEGRYVFLSKNYLRYLGVRSEEMLDKTDFDCWPQATAEQFRSNDQQVLVSNRAIEVLEQGWDAEGNQTWWLCHKFPYQDESGKRFVGGLGVDITQHKRTEDALRESERQLSLVMQAANVGLWDWDLSGDQVHFSPEWKRQLGYADHEIADRFEEWQSRVHPDDLEPTLAKVRSYLEKQWPGYEVEFRMRHKEGSWRWILSRAALIEGPTGKAIRMIGIHLDITARKAIEESLRESEERLRLANEAANIGSYFADLETDRVRYSPELCAMLGIETGIDRKVEDGFHFVQPEDLPRMRADFDAALNPAGDGRQRTELRIVRLGGEVRWLVNRGQVAFRDTPAGRVPWRMVGACLDITERKQIEEALRQLNDELEERVAERTRVLYAKQERLQAILNNDFNAVLTCDRQGLVESVNLAAVRMFGEPAEEMIGQDFQRFVPPPDGQPQGESRLRNLKLMTGYSLEVVAHRKEGSTFPAEMAVSEITHLGLFCVILRDISEHKRLERDVAEATAYEQRRIGQDLHDSVGQQLTALTMLAQDFVESLAPDAQPPNSRLQHSDQNAKSPTLACLSPFELAERLRRDLHKALEQIRSISRNLNPVPIDSQGLTAALTDLVERMQLQSRVRCSFDCELPVLIEDNVTGTHLFHIAQEALSNALRHADAREVQIELQQSDLQVVLRIRDDGRGVAWPLPQREGIGMRIMKSRADMIGATLSIDRAKPRGTVVTCALANVTKHRI